MEFNVGVLVGATVILGGGLVLAGIGSWLVEWLGDLWD